VVAGLDDPILAARFMVPAAYEFRVPGSPDWHLLERREDQGVNVRLFSGDREWLTTPATLWPVRLVMVTCPICGGRGVDAELVICAGCDGRREVSIAEALSDG
jgi:hypothetical protein